MGDQAVHVTDVGGGSPIRTRSRSIAGTTYDEQVVIRTDYDVETGLYICHVGAFTVGVAAHAATAGFWWLVNTSTSTVLRVRRVRLLTMPTAATAFPSCPRVTLERITFTGTPSGATVTPGKRINASQNGYTADATAVGSVRTASTGLTITAGAQMWSGSVGVPIAANGWAPPDAEEYNPADKETIYLANGEGIVCRQPDAGSTSDTRSVRCGVTWEEVTLP